MLISQDMLQVLSKHVEPPAQLCLVRLVDSNNDYVFRVRYKDVHLDYPFNMPLSDTAYREQLTEVCKALHVMSKMVIPPGELDRNWNPHPQPVILSPMKFIDNELYRYIY